MTMAPMTMPFNPVQVFAVALLFCIIYYAHWEFTVGSSRRALIRKHGCKPIKDTPKYNSFPHNIFSLKVMKESVAAFEQLKLLETVQGRYTRHGSTLHLKVLFKDLFQTIEVENIKSMLATNFKDWSLPNRRKMSVTPLLGDGIFTTDGAAWQHSRELLRPNFVRSQVGDMDTFETHVEHLIKAIPRDGSTVNLQDLFFLMTLDSATEFLFGESTNCLAPGEKNEVNFKFADAFNYTQMECMKTFRTGLTHPWLRPKRFSSDVKFIHKFADKYVEKGLEYRKMLDLEKADPRAKERYVFLYELVKSTNDPLRIRSELLNILLAGRDTTASLLADVFFVLARRPDIWSKLQTEISTLGGQRPSYQQTKDFKYLRMVLNECLRLYPVVPFNAREAAVDTVLPLGGGEDGESPLFIPKGKVVQYSVYALHRRKDLYGEDADDFKPERWETLRPGWVRDPHSNPLRSKDIDTLQEYLPFNGGPRICIGQQFALTEASYTIIRLLQEFKNIENRDPEPWKEWITLTVRVALFTTPCSTLHTQDMAHSLARRSHQSLYANTVPKIDC